MIRIFGFGDSILHFIQQYEDFLYSSGVTGNTVACHYLRNLRTLYNQAMMDGFQLRREYPFVKAQTRPAKTVKRALIPENPSIPRKP